jgi:uncharacterized protein (TIGR02266 family)
MYASRREHLRIPMAVGVSLSSDHNFYVGWSENISEGGLFVVTHELLPVGTRVEVTLEVAGQLEPTTLTCQVCWHRKTDELTSDCEPGMGLSFLDLAPETEEKIQTFVSVRREAMFIDM